MYYAFFFFCQIHLCNLSSSFFGVNSWQTENAKSKAVAHYYRRQRRRQTSYRCHLRATAAAGWQSHRNAMAACCWRAEEWRHERSEGSSSGSLCKWMPPKLQKQSAQIIYIMKKRKRKNAKRQWSANKRRAACGMCYTYESCEWLWTTMNAFHIALEQEIVRARINVDWQKAETALLLFLCAVRGILCQNQWRKRRMLRQTRHKYA